MVVTHERSFSCRRASVVSVTRELQFALFLVERGNFPPDISATGVVSGLDSPALVGDGALLRHESTTVPSQSTIQKQNCVCTDPVRSLLEGVHLRNLQSVLF